MKKITFLLVTIFSFLTGVLQAQDGYTYTLVNNGTNSFTIAAVPNASANNFATVIQSYGITVIVPDGVTLSITSSLGSGASATFFNGTDVAQPTIDGYLITETLGTPAIISAPSAATNTTMITVQVNGSPADGTIYLLANNSALATSVTPLKSFMMADMEDDAAPGYLNKVDPNATALTSPFSFDFASVVPNGAPGITGTLAGQTVNDNATVSPFSTITTSDADGDNLSATITLDNNAKGVLTGTYLIGTGPYTIASTTPADLQTKLRALSFNPTDNRTTTSETTTFTVDINDGTTTASNNTTTVISSAVAPTVSSLFPTDDATSVLLASNLEITFSENVTKGTGNITIYDAEDDSVVEAIDVNTAAVSITNAVVTINPITDLAYNKSYYVQIAATAFKDAADNTFAGVTDQTSWSFTTPKPLANIVISEIMYNTPESGIDVYEYIELYNAGTATVDLTGYTFSQGVTHTFTTGSIGVGEYFVIAINATKLDEAFGDGTADAQWTSGSLSNGGEDIELLDNLSRVVDYVNYDDNTPWPTGADGDGPSIELRDVTFDNNVAANWSSSTDPRDIRTNVHENYGNNLLMTGTPGAAAIFIKPDANNILYVNKNAITTGEGDSWANAIPELADALVWAQNNKANFTTTPLQVWVAGGTYIPMYSPEDGANFGTNQGRDNAFLLVNNVQLYGGFAGTETLLTDRDLSLTANKTILSGDIGTIDVNTDNCYHVVISTGAIGTARLDGFTVTGGFTSGSSNLTVNNEYVLRIRGGGMYNNNSSPTITNTTFIGNTATNNGGGMYNDNNSSPTITNTTFIGNTSAKSGGGMYNKNNSSPTITNSTFSGNTATNDGGGMFNDTFSIKVYNSIITGTVYDGISSPVYKNSIIADKSYDNTGAATTTNLTATDLFKDPTNGDYSLNKYSPAINAGDNTLYTGTIATDKDLAGNARLFAGTPDPDVIDLGAYEFQAEPLKITPTNGILYVNKTATGNKTGDSWANAIPELADALIWAHNNKANFTTTPLQIWVAGGTYKPMYSPEDGVNFGTDQSRDNVFLMVNNVQLYGGFAGTETLLTDRDLSLTVNKTILSGDIGTVDDTADNTYHVVISINDVGTARLDGFTINDGLGNGSSNLTVNSIRIYRFRGGGMVNYKSSPLIINSTFSENTTSSLGGGMYNYDNSSPTIINSIFSSNRSTDYGGGMYNSYDSSPTITNTTFSGNTANSGGGMYNSNSSPKVYNSIITGTVYDGISSPVYKNSIIADKSYDNTGAATTTNLTATDIFKDSANGDYSLNAFSPAINAGDNTLYTGTIATDKDLAGNARLFDGLSNDDKIDIGAYEFQAEPINITPTDNIVYVNKNVTAGNKTGDSWENAVPELADALVWANKKKTNFTSTPLQIWVSGGTYKPMYSPEDGKNFVSDGRNNSFLLVNNVQLYGGFAGTENTLAERDLSLTANKTILSGDLGILDATADNAYHVMVSAGDIGIARLDGFTISSGYADSNAPALLINTKEVYSCSGAGIYNSESAPFYTNLSIKENSCTESGGGIFSYKSTPSLTNVTLTNNQAKDGGGMANQFHSSATLLNVSILNNSATTKGSGMYNVDESDATLINVTLAGNRATVESQLDGVGCEGESTVAFKNSIIWDDISGEYTAHYSLVKGKSETTDGNINATGLTEANIFNDPTNGDFSLKNDSTNPTINSGDNSLYTGTLATDKDLAGNARLFVGIPDPAIIDLGAYELQTEPTIKIRSTSPADDATGVSPISNLTLTFYESIVKGTGNITVHDASNDATVETIAVTSGNVSITDKMVTINPTVNLAYNKSYYIQIAATAFKDGADNNFVGILDKITWSFATKTNVAPTFTSVPVTSVNENAAYSYTITTNDIDGDGQIVTATTSPSWLTLTSTTTVSTLAGSGTGDFSDGTGTAAQFKFPQGVAIDASGTIYVADSGNRRIRKITPAGVVTTLAGGTIGSADGTGTAAQFKYPVGIAIDASGIIYVSDADAGNIRKITPEGVVTTLAGGKGAYSFADGIGTEAGFNQPNGIAVDAAGNLYVADSQNHRIRKITPDGVVTTFAGSNTYGSADGTGAAAQFDRPNGIAIDAAGNLYVADIANNKIRKISSDGVVTTLAEIGLADTGSNFNVSYGITLDAENNVYVTDLNKKILKITPDGVVTTLAGSTYGFADGSGTAAQFKSPYGVAVDASGTVYVADQFNNRIRKITQTNFKLTGTPTAEDIGDNNVVLQVSDGKATKTQSFTISVKDITAPTITSTSPADDATGVSPISNLTLTFNESIVKGTGNITVHDASNDATVETIAATSGNVSITGNVVTINPTTNLLKSKNYYLQIGSTAFKDIANNNFAGISDKTTWNFATELKATPTISFADFTKTYGDTAFDLAATSTSSATVMYSVVAGGTGEVNLSGKNITLVNAGTVTLKASVAENANYLAAEKEIILTINKATSVLSAEAVQTFTYDGTLKNVIASLNHSETTLTYSPSQGYTDAGSYAITVSAAATTNYTAASASVTLAIDKATQTGLEFSDGIFTYDGTAKSIAVTGMSNDATVVYENNGSINAGVYSVKATVSRANYQDAVLTATVTINKATSILSAEAVQTFTYDGTLKNVIASLNHSETTLTYSPSQGYTDAGSYAITVSAAATTNYTAASASVTLAIDKAIQTGLVFSDGIFTYDGTAKSIGVTGMASDATVVYQDNDKTDAGVYSVNATVSRPNYQDAVLNATLTINKATSVITAVAVQTFTYDGTLKNVIASLNHSETTLTYSPSQGYTDAGSYAITVSAAATTNYTAASASVTLAIDKAIQTGLVFSDGIFTYDGTAKSIGVTGMASDATVVYQDNDKTDAGVYSVNA
ncbi:Ig-like domain-containing protein, partial [Polaribacter sp. MSW13]